MQSVLSSLCFCSVHLPKSFCQFTSTAMQSYHPEIILALSVNIFSVFLDTGSRGQSRTYVSLSGAKSRTYSFFEILPRSMYAFFDSCCFSKLMSKAGKPTFKKCEWRHAKKRNKTKVKWKIAKFNECKGVAAWYKVLGQKCPFKRISPIETML